MNIKAAVKVFGNDPTFFFRNQPKLYGPLLKIARERKPDGWVEGMPLWIVPKEIIKDAIAVAPHRLLFISDGVDKNEWIKIARHEKLEIELVNQGYKPEEAHKIASKRIG